MLYTTIAVLVEGHEGLQVEAVAAGRQQAELVLCEGVVVDGHVPTSRSCSSRGARHDAEGPLQVVEAHLPREGLGISKK